LVKADTPVEADRSEYSIKDKAIHFFQSKVRWLAFKLHPAKKEGKTASISRNHAIEVSENGLVSLMGGKWTSFRS
jgi:glycerol-3-phosphate dehydrogenase